MPQTDTGSAAQPFGGTPSSAPSELRTGRQGGQPGGGFPPPPPILSGEEAYDMIMGGIEPDLTTAQLPLLKEKYKDEMPEQAKERAERYSKAFAEYDRQYAQFTAAQEKAVSEYERQFMQGVQDLQRGSETVQLTELSSAIDAA